MKKIRLYPSLKEINYIEGESILSTLEKSGFALPNNCRAGACGECKMKIRQGEIDQGFILDMALSQKEREEGFALMCMAKMKSDLVEVEWADVDARPKLFPPLENVQYMVIEKLMVTNKLLRLKIKALANPIRFWPGQYIQIGDMNKDIPYRSYSIANIPNSEGEIILYIANTQSGTSKWIHENLVAGDRLKINGPYGTFVGNPTAETPVLCLAQGSGLAPIMSLASAALLRGGFKYPATIIFSAKTKDDVFEKGLFKFLSTKFRNFKFNATYTGEQYPNELFGRIQKILPELYKDLSGYSVYIAGAPGFVEENLEICKALGAKRENIHTEGFYSTPLK
ncbi:MAG: 2Fe-2S iron-sulfur cluster binding domain-containing protein [Bacteriovorax sp.]|jgi:CDP-4-dehydro-6-deoxyglucose reductase